MCRTVVGGSRLGVEAGAASRSCSGVGVWAARLETDKLGVAR